VLEYFWKGEAPLAHLGLIQPNVTLIAAPWCVHWSGAALLVLHTSPAPGDPAALLVLHTSPPSCPPFGASNAAMLPATCCCEIAKWWLRWRLFRSDAGRPKLSCASSPPVSLLNQRRWCIGLVGVLLANGLGLFAALGNRSDDDAF
jgi:hypothetical protein